MRKLVMLGTKVIPGASTVEFEKVVRDRVLESIDNARTNTVELLRTSYQAIKNKLGRIPNLVKKLFLEEVRIGVFTRTTVSML